MSIVHSWRCEEDGYHTQPLKSVLLVSNTEMKNHIFRTRSRASSHFLPQTDQMIGGMQLVFSRDLESPDASMCKELNRDSLQHQDESDLDKRSCRNGASIRVRCLVLLGRRGRGRCATALMGSHRSFSYLLAVIFLISLHLQQYNNMESHQENPNLSDIPSTHRQLAQLGHVHTRPINRPLQGEALHSGRQNDRQDTYQDDSQDDRPSYQPRHTQVGLHDSATLQADPHQQVRKKKKEKKRGTRPPLPSSTSLNASQYERDTQQQVPDIDAMPLEDEHGRIDDDIERHFRGFRARLEAHAQEVPNTEWMYHVSSWFELDAVDALVHEQRRLRTMMSSVAASESLWASKHQEVHREHQELDRKHAEMDRQHEELHSQLRR